MALSEKQQKVISFALQNEGKITKKQAMELIDDYYHNGAKYVGEILSTMVKAKLLVRIKPGHFEIGKGTRSKGIPVNENQKTLF